MKTFAQLLEYATQTTPPVGTHGVPGMPGKPGMPSKPSAPPSGKSPEETKAILKGADDNKPITWDQISALRDHLDVLWQKLGIDVSFTHHFMDRVNDPRNKRQITLSELARLFTKTWQMHGREIANKVKPESHAEFQAVLTDLSTKVNLPFVLEWNPRMKELRLIAKTVMRKDDFKTPDPKLTVQHFDPETLMKQKTFFDLKEWIGFNTPEVAPIPTVQAIDDVDSAAFSVEQPDILNKLNAYCHQIANHQYINPYTPLNKLWNKLSLIGINFNLKSIMMPGESGRVVVPLNRFGGRYGVLNAPHTDYIGQDDGIGIPGGLNLVLTYVKTNGTYSLDAVIEHGSVTLPFGEEEIKEWDNRTDAEKRAPYSGPTPRGKHSHRCNGCKKAYGQTNAVACYKKNCTAPKLTDTCSHCRASLPSATNKSSVNESTSKTCPNCGSSHGNCAECGTQYAHGSATACTKAACKSMNAPIDCKCGFSVDHKGQGVLDHDMNLHPFKSGSVKKK